MSKMLPLANRIPSRLCIRCVYCEEDTEDGYVCSRWLSPVDGTPLYTCGDARLMSQVCAPTGEEYIEIGDSDG